MELIYFDFNIKYKWIRMRSRNLEVEDDGPDESQHNGGTSVHNISSVDVHQLDLDERWSEMVGVNFEIDLWQTKLDLRIDWRCLSLQLIC